MSARRMRQSRVCKRQGAGAGATAFGVGLLVALACSAPRAASQTYHVDRTYHLTGDGGWDLLALDEPHHRLFIAHQDRVIVVDPETGAALGDISGFNRAHGIAFAYAEGHGFATSGGDSSVVMFDLSTLHVLSRTAAAPDADGILYDPASRRIFSFNGDSRSATVIDPVTGQRIGTIDLPGKPEFGVPAGNGKLYVNLEDQNAIAEIDAVSTKVMRRWSLAPCEGPTGLAIDRVHRRLFSGCRSGVLAISDITAGRVITTLPIGPGVDACRFDSSERLAFASSGGDSGTITLVREETPDSFRVVGTVITRRGARTMELDPRTHHLYTVSAGFGPTPTPTPEHPRPRPVIIPGTFVLLVIVPEAMR